MGELSKLIGEEGERIALGFFEKIGWKSPVANTTLPCANPVLHKRKDTEKRTTHGIDLAFSYRSQTDTNTVQHVIISCKATENSYTSPVSKFKDYVVDLAHTMKCFSRSDKKSEWAKRFSNFNRQADCGILFWISLTDPHQSVLDRVASCQIPDGLDFGTIYLVDNSVVNFHFDIYDFLVANYPGYDKSYFVPHTALSISDRHSARRATVMPIEYINSPFLWILLDNRIISDEKPIMLLVTKDNFCYDSFSMYLAAARDLVQDITDRFAFAFYDYVDYKHASVVDAVLQGVLQEANLDVKVFPVISDFRRSNG